MKVVCHIGTPKTASTYLQDNMAANKKWLMKHGILYPDLFSRDANHITLFYVSSLILHPFARAHGINSQEEKYKYRQKVIEKLASQIEEYRDRCHTFFLSSENLTGNLHAKRGIESLHDLFSGLFDEIEIVIYLRRQDKALLSMYSEHMRRGFSAQRLDRFVENCLDKPGILPYLHYDTLLTKWAGVFGKKNIKVLAFEQSRLQASNIFQDILSRSFPEIIFDMEGLDLSKQKNESLSAPALEFLRHMQPHIPFADQNGVNHVRASLANLIDKLPKNPRLQFSSDVSKEIQKFFRDSNSYLNENYFNVEPLDWVSYAIDEAGVGNANRVTHKEFAQFSYQLFLERMNKAATGASDP